MKLVRWNPSHDLVSMHDSMNRLMNEFFGPPLVEGESPVLWRPAVDIEEAADGYTVRAEIPGMRLEDIRITLEDSQLVIRGEKRRNEEKKGTTYHRVERVYGTFERAFTLSHAVRSDKIEATYRDGVLVVSIPKAEEAKAREIPIKIAQ